jgi:hypothetical protein
MELKYTKQPKPPVCLHALGQSLVTSLWNETQELKARLEIITSQADAQFKAGDRYATFGKQTIDSLRL